MKKLIISLLLIILVTGCSFKYDLKIGKDTIDELGTISNQEKTTWNEKNDAYFGKTFVEYIKRSIEYYEPVYDSTIIDSYEGNDKLEGVEYYDKKLISESDNYGMGISYIHDISKFHDSRLLNLCYNEVKVNTDNEVISINTSEQFGCFDRYEMLDDVEINVSPSWDYKVVSSNADEIENGKYIWNITKDNADNKPIKIELKKIFNWRLALLIGIPSVALVVLGYFFLTKKAKENNEI